MLVASHRKRHTIASRKTDKTTKPSSSNDTRNHTLKVLQLGGKPLTLCKCINSDIVLFLSVEQSLQSYACRERNIKIKY